MKTEILKSSYSIKLMCSLSFQHHSFTHSIHPLYFVKFLEDRIHPEELPGVLGMRHKAQKTGLVVVTTPSPPIL